MISGKKIKNKMKRFRVLFILLFVVNLFFINIVSAETKDEVLFGFWGLNGFLDNKQELKDVKHKFNMTVFQVASEDPHYLVHHLLPKIKKANLKVTLRLTGSHKYYTTNHNFNLEKWKKRLAKWQVSGIKKYINNGTIVGHMLLDDIYNFKGADPTATELDEMARYSEELFPNLMTYVRNQASTMPKGKYQYLDAIDNQYSTQEGDINDYVKKEYKAAKKHNFKIINGLNICDGGDGSSGQLGWRTDGEFYAMSAEEITKYGEALLNMSDVNMFLMWEYDGEETWHDGTIGSDYFNQTSLQQAIYNLGKNVILY